MFSFGKKPRPSDEQIEIAKLKGRIIALERFLGGLMARIASRDEPYTALIADDMKFLDDQLRRFKDAQKFEPGDLSTKIPTGHVSSILQYFEADSEFKQSMCLSWIMGNVPDRLNALRPKKSENPISNPAFFGAPDKGRLS